MKRIITLLLWLAPALPAQTLSPLIQEFGKKVNSSFTVTNNSTGPLTVVIKPVAVTYVEGRKKYFPIDGVVNLKIDHDSFVIGPLQSHVVFFKATCAALPCAFNLNNQISTPHHEGLNAVLILPEVLYVCDKQKYCRRNTLAAWGVQ